MIHHIALTVNDFSDINNFYEDVLNLSKLYQFILSDELSQKIFSKEKGAEVYVMKKNDIQFEIFVSKQKEGKVFSHTCLTYENSEEILQKAKTNGYKVVVKPNHGKKDTYFIWDRSGNLFEIKEDE